MSLLTYVTFDSDSPRLVSSGRSTGIMHLTYTSKLHAASAIRKYHNALLDGQPISVELLTSSSSGLRLTSGKTYAAAYLIPLARARLAPLTLCFPLPSSVTLSSGAAKMHSPAAKPGVANLLSKALAPASTRFVDADVTHVAPLQARSYKQCVVCNAAPGLRRPVGGAAAGRAGEAAAGPAGSGAR